MGVQAKIMKPLGVGKRELSASGPPGGEGVLARRVCGVCHAPWPGRAVFRLERHCPCGCLGSCGCSRRSRLLTGQAVQAWVPAGCGTSPWSPVHLRRSPCWRSPFFGLHHRDAVCSASWSVALWDLELWSPSSSLWTTGLSWRGPSTSMVLICSFDASLTMLPAAFCEAAWRHSTRKKGTQAGQREPRVRACWSGPECRSGGWQ